VHLIVHDDAFIGHEYLSGLKSYEHMWGIGRHLLSSQVYDYWADPDRLNARNGGNRVPAEEGLRSQWGSRPPENFQARQPLITALPLTNLLGHEPWGLTGLLSVILYENDMVSKRWAMR
jgi:hypothetical protein